MFQGRSPEDKVIEELIRQGKMSQETAQNVHAGIAEGKGKYKHPIHWAGASETAEVPDANQTADCESLYDLVNSRRRDLLQNDDVVRDFTRRERTDYEEGVRSGIVDEVLFWDPFHQYIQQMLTFRVFGFERFAQKVNDALLQEMDEEFGTEASNPIGQYILQVAATMKTMGEMVTDPSKKSDWNRMMIACWHMQKELGAVQAVQSPAREWNKELLQELEMMRQWFDQKFRSRFSFSLLACGARTTGASSLKEAEARRAEAWGVKQQDRCGVACQDTVHVRAEVRNAPDQRRVQDNRVSTLSPAEQSFARAC